MRVPCPAFTAMQSAYNPLLGSARQGPRAIGAVQPADAPRAATITSPSVPLVRADTWDARWAATSKPNQPSERVTGPDT